MATAERDLAKILALRDEAFVREAYRALLGREADRSGLGSYVGQLREGVEKRQILADLARSEEGRQRAAAISGLADILAQYPRPTPPFWARVVRRLTGPALEPTATQLRVIDNRVYLIERALAEATRQLSDIHRLLRQGGLQLNAGQMQQSSATDARSAPAPQPSEMPAPVRSVYGELKSALDEKTRR